MYIGTKARQIDKCCGLTAAVDIPKDFCLHVSLVITGAQAKLYVSNMDVPSLVVNDMKSGFRRGGIKLGEGPHYISNFEVREMPPAPWERREPAMPAATLSKWALSQSMDALECDLEHPLS